MGRITRDENLQLTWSTEVICHLQPQGLELGNKFSKVFSILSAIYEKECVLYPAMLCKWLCCQKLETIREASHVFKKKKKRAFKKVIYWRGYSLHFE